MIHPEGGREQGGTCLIAHKTKGVNPLIKALGTFLEQVIKWSIAGGTEKYGLPSLCHVASHVKAHPDSKGVVDEPPFKKTIKLLIQTF